MVVDYSPNIGETVWVEPRKKGEFNLYWSAKVVKHTHSKITVVTEDEQTLDVNPSDIVKSLKPSDVDPLDDMINLSDLNEHSILRNIYLRYRKNVIYTYTGGILVAVNPYKSLDIYSECDIASYQGKRLIALSPHIYAIGAQALANLKRHFQNQCIVISGETGSGKTESTKLLLNFLAACSSKSQIGNKVILANPILEAFGNAKTTKNDNSSRFGKYIEILFRQDGSMRSACIQHYLLEKSRIKSQNLGDRNYHIFYIMLAGLSQQSKDQLKLTVAKDYFYLKQGGNVHCDGRDEKAEFLTLKDAFITLNFSENDVSSINKILAAILHIGNFSYKTIPKGNEEATAISKNIHLASATTLLSLNEKHFIEALTHKTILVEGTKVVSEMSIEKATRSRDAFAMSLYNNLFSFILTKVNKSISDAKVSRYPSIGILDIFGFENFTSNNFEQLCINYANEHLQQFFVQHVFKLEQSEYSNEGIQWECLLFEDNQEVLELMGLGKMSIFMIIDEQTRFPKGEDKSFMLKCNQAHAENKNYIKAKSDHSLMFGIKHYAGSVTYSVEGFIEKNMNILSLEWRDVIRESDSQFLKNLFMKELNSIMKGKALTLAGQYRQSLESLLKTLGNGSPFFIRCIKPNSNKKPHEFNHELVCQQLRYSGMMETAKIRQMGYPIRYTYVQFVLRYRILVVGSPPISQITDMQETGKTVCRRYLAKDEFQFGKTKIFLKIPDEKLEIIRDQILTKSAITLQKEFRALRARLRFLRMRAAAIVIQRYWRGYKPRAAFRLVQHGYLRLQAVLRSRKVKRDYAIIRAKIIRFQAKCRGLLSRRNFKNKRKHSKKLLIPPVPKPRKGSMPEIWIDKYITNIFDSAVEGKSNSTAGNIHAQLRPSANGDSLKEILDNTKTLSFQKFAAAHFTGNINGKFSNKILNQPLLDLTSLANQMAATVIWVTILRFMGDLEETASWTKPMPKTRKSIMSQLQATVSKSFLNSKEYISIVNALKLEEQKSIQETLESGKKKLLNISLAHRNKLQREANRADLEIAALKRSYEEWALGPPSALLDKLHFIIGHGILHPDLRDEIYCQICKQLTDNNDPVSTMYGWILLTLCTTSFPPSSKLTPTLLHFLAKGGNMLGCVTKLQRTLENGARAQPPTAFELSALKAQTQMYVDVFLLDDSAIKLEVDSATTASDMCKVITSKLNLHDTFGFSLFVSMFGQTIPLENGKWFLMDAISQCETRASEKGLPDIEAPWTVVFRRDSFPPWPLLSNDAISIHLTYCQIIKGVKLGDYRCCQESELAVLVAQHYYISFGKRLLPELLDSFLKEVMPGTLLKQKNKNWSKAVSDAFNKSFFIKRKITEEEVKTEVVNFSKKKWPLLFSRYYEITQIAGFYLGASDLLLAINSEGIFIVKNNTEIIMKILYSEIVSIDCVNGSSTDKDQIHLFTIRHHRYVFKSKYSRIVCNTVNSTIDELILKSKYAIAVKDYIPPDDSFLGLHTGDLVVIRDHPIDGKWMKGCHVDSGHIGELPRRVVQILPCIERPPLYIMEFYRDVLVSKTENKNFTPLLLIKKHTLEGYADRYFRSDQSKGKEELWKYSNNKLWSPLHRSLSSLAHIVTPMYNAILHYMGDRPQPGQARYSRTIFEPPLYHEVIRDELYCLLLKQMTENPNTESIRIGWELLLLATCLFPPSSVLLKDVEEWLTTRTCEMSGECLRRLKTITHTGCRLHPHHWLEVSSAQDHIPILHPVSFPNNMEQIFEIDPFMKVNELVDIISNWLGLTTSEGFSLIVVVDNSAVSLPPQEYLFDSILDTCQFPTTANGHETPKYSYDLLFVKKLWLNTYAGLDRTADVVCHYYQELPKYIAGSHNCTPGDAMYLGALVFIAELDEYNCTFDASKEILGKLQHLVPEQLVHGLSPHEWMYGIISAYEENKGLKSDDAKIMFLKVTQNWPNFGSAFFSVYLSSSMQDAYITLVVNRHGICLVHPLTQEILIVHSYSEILGCSFTDSSFTLTAANHSYVWFTKTSQKIADLVNSYIEAFDMKYMIS